MKHFYLFFVLFSNLLFSQNPINWQVLNPQPSKDDGVDIKMLNSNVGFYITNKEIVQTTDAGASWKIVSKIKSANDLDFSGNTGIVVGNDSSVYLSKDNGNTWSSKSLNPGENFIYAKVISDNILLISTSKKLFTSTDGGVTWPQKAIPFYNVSKIYFLNDQFGILGTSDGMIYKTTDGGNNWVLKSSTNVSPSDIFNLYFVNSSIGFAERGHGELLKTVNGGETWTKISNLSDKIYSFCFLSENIGYAGGQDGVIYKTSDGGNSWVQKFFQNGWVGDSDIRGIFFNSENEGFAVGMRGRIIKTANSGDNWSAYSPFYNDIGKISKIDNQLLAQVGLDIFKTTDEGTSWTKLSRPDDFNSQNVFNGSQYSSGMSFLTKNLGYIIGGQYQGDSRIYKTEDGGASWVLKKDFDASHINDLSFIDENTGFVSCGEGTMQYGFYRTLDGGNTWDIQNSQQLFSKIKAFSKDLVYASTYNSLYKSTDGGKNWTLIFNDDNQQLTDINFLDQDNGYVIGNQSFSMRKTSDGGVTWTKLLVPYDFYKIVRFKNANIGVIANEYGKMSVTYNGGRDWETELENYGSKDFIYAGNNFYVAGTYGKIFNGIFKNIPDYVLTTTSVNNFGATKVTFTGSGASNSTDITELKFIYSTSSSFINPITVDANIAKINALTSNEFKADVTALQPNTRYYVKTVGKLNGNNIYGNIINFTTLPAYSLSLNNASSLFATSVNLDGGASANGGNLSNIKFQYSITNSAFDQSVDSNPFNITQGNANLILNGNVTGLKPGTNYFARIVADYNGEKVYSNVVNFTTLAEYYLSLDEAYLLSANAVDLYASVNANDKDITDLIYQYGGANFESSSAASPSLVAGQTASYVTASLNKSSLEPNKNYYLRLKGITNGKDIYSNTVLFRLDKSLILVNDRSEFVSDNEVKINGLLKSYSYNGLSNISIQYGKTGDLGITKLCTPSYNYSSSTFPVSVNLTQLESQTTYYYKFSAVQNGITYYSDLYQFNTSPLAVVNSTKKKFQIFPNPVEDELFLEGSEKATKIEVFDLAGKLVIADFRKNMKSLKVNRLPRATYIIKVYSGAEVTTSQFIKR